jgi:diadenosine tetraphosphatase ApaH/serine/threonine PP2A family protein phosphatase
MKVAVISDIHANLYALEAVLGALRAEAPDEIWCLGDTVGYGPEPNRCCALVAEHASVCLAGNHDLAVVRAISVEEFNGDAAAAVRWTQNAIDEPSLAFLRGLAPQAQREGVELFHGSPLDPVWDYVLSEQAASASFAATSAPLLLVGHSHIALVLALVERRIVGGLAPADTPVQLAEARFLLNPGSVGQPRGNDPRAAWLLLDLEAQTASFRRTVYPIDSTQAQMRAGGLPEALAARLALGV